MQVIAANPRPDSLAESKDCVVRALSLAFNKPYLDVHAICAKVGRRKHQGMRTPAIDAAIGMLTGNMADGLQQTTKYNRVHTDKHPRLTFAQFAAKYPKGRFVVVMRGHALALIDGVYHDMYSAAVGARCRVCAFYEVNSTSTADEA